MHGAWACRSGESGPGKGRQNRIGGPVSLDRAAAPRVTVYTRPRHPIHPPSRALIPSLVVFSEPVAPQSNRCLAASTNLNHHPIQHSPFCLCLSSSSETLLKLHSTALAHRHGDL